MKNKRIFWVVVILVMIIIIISSLLVAVNKNSEDTMNSDEIPDGYIAIFHGGVGERTYETYIYKNNNGHENSDFDYINVTSATVYWGSKQCNRKITKQGTVQWTDDVFSVAKENNAYSFVTLPNSNKTYTIEEYMNMFLMN